MPWTCPGCGLCAEPVIEIVAPNAETGRSGVLRRCGSCMMPCLEEQEHTEVHAKATGAGESSRIVSTVKAATSTVSQPIAPTAAQSKQSKRLGAKGTIKSARAEERELRATIKRLERELKIAKAEHTKLARLLDAADARPRAVVRPIKSAG